MWMDKQCGMILEGEAISAELEQNIIFYKSPMLVYP